MQFVWKLHNWLLHNWSFWEKLLITSFFLTWVIGDLTTTALALSTGKIVEANPFFLWVSLENFAILVGLKLFAFAFLLLGFRFVWAKGWKKAFWLAGFIGFFVGFLASSWNFAQFLGVLMVFG